MIADLRPVPLPAIRHPAATRYGFVIDWLWSDQSHVARRPSWPEGMHIGQLPCIDLDEEFEANGNVGAMTTWIFFDDGVEYTAPVADTLADDWLIGQEREDEADGNAG